MSDIFLKLLNMNLSASWLIVAVIILRLIARKTPKWIICLLWGLVAIKLICPFSIESSFSIVPLDEVITKSILSESQQEVNKTIGMKPAEVINEYLGETYRNRTSVEYTYGNILMSVISLIWLCGVFGLLFYMVIMNLRLRGHLKEAVLLQEKIYLCDYVHSPFIFGLFSPKIYLPSRICESDMEYVIAHEEAHIQRKDHVWKVIGFLVLSIYWFNPLSWVAFILFCRDVELACDEKVIKKFSMAEKKAYSESLLSCSYKKNIKILSLAFGELGVKQRVKFILSYKKTTFGVMFLSFSSIILIGFCFFTTSTQQYQNVMVPINVSPTQIQINEKENELQQLLLDYNNVVKALVSLQEYNNVISFANILIISKEKIMSEYEKNEIKTFALDYLNLDDHNINLEYADN